MSGRIGPHRAAPPTWSWGLARDGARLPDTERSELFAIPITAILIALVARGRAAMRTVVCEQAGNGTRAERGAGEARRGMARRGEGRWRT